MRPWIYTPWLFWGVEGSRSWKLPARPLCPLPVPCSLFLRKWQVAGRDGSQPLGLSGSPWLCRLGWLLGMAWPVKRCWPEWNGGRIGKSSWGGSDLREQEKTLAEHSGAPPHQSPYPLLCDHRDVRLSTWLVTILCPRSTRKRGGLGRLHPSGAGWQPHPPRC